MCKIIILLSLILSLSNSRNLKKSYTITINSKEYTTDKEYSMMKFLRDDLGLKSVKDGCNEGACGSCSIIVDGELQKTCIRKIPDFDGKKIITVEGLTDREKEVYNYAFESCGAVQCGYCTPGMVLAGKSLIDQNNNPTREEAAIAIRNNICRCTGYVKIIDAILLAAKIFREDIHDFKKIDTDKLGKGAFRVDSREKILGYGKYVDDITIDGMIYGAAVRSKYPRAKVLSIDVSKAKALKGVRSVLTAEDIPNNVNGHFVLDHNVLIGVGDITHFLGDPIVLIAADNEEILEEAKKLVKIEYQELKGIFTPQEALKPDAPKLHENGNILEKFVLKRGYNIDEEFKNAPFVVSKSFYTPWGEHAYLDREVAVAIYDEETGSALVYTTDQCAHDTQRMCARAMNWEVERVKIQHVLIGGGFGGKVGDVTVQHHALVLAYYTHLPVKFKLTRDESFLIHAKRHPAWIDVTTSADKNGKLIATKVRAIIDTGAYAIVGQPVCRILGDHSAGPYSYRSVDIEVLAVYTNNPPAGAYRGFGCMQATFCFESTLNLLAEKVGISPWEIRYINAVRPGQSLPSGQKALPSTALVETLEAVKEIYESSPLAGIACGYKNAGFGGGVPEYGRAKLSVIDGVVHFNSGATEIGQGLNTIVTQMIRDTLNLNENQVIVHNSSTHDAPDSMTTAASRITVFAGEATRRACNKLKEKLDSVNGDLSKLNGQIFYGEYKSETKPFDPYAKDQKLHTKYSYETQVVLLNEDGSIKKVVAALDVGRALNPLSIEGQMEGGVAQGLGFALTEDFPVVDGKPLVKMSQLGLFKSTQVPPIETIIVEKAKPEDLSYGAIGIGEVVLVPTGPACQGAYYQLDGKFRTELPLRDTFYDKKKQKTK